MTNPNTAGYTQPEPEHIASATLLLTRVLAGRPPVDAALSVAAALNILNDVHPCYPPQPEHVDPLPVEEGVPSAFDAFVAAIDAAQSPEERLRIARAGRELRLYLEHTGRDLDGGPTP